MSASILPIQPASAAPSDIIWLTDDVVSETSGWLVDRLIPQEGIGFFIGRSSAGKSTLALHLAMCLMAGRDFFGRAISQRAGTAYIDGEMQHDFKLRVIAPSRELGIEPSQRAIALHPRVPVLSTVAGQEEFRRYLVQVSEGMVRRWGIPLKLVVLDTFGQTTLIDNENDASKLNQALRPLRLIAKDLDLVILFTHHIGRGQGKDAWKFARGSSAFRDNADFMVHIEHGKEVQEVWADKVRGERCEVTLGHLKQKVVDLNDIRPNATACVIEEVTGWSPVKLGRKPKPAAATGEEGKVGKQSTSSLKEAESADNIFLIAVEETAGGGLAVKEVKKRFATHYRAAKGDVTQVAIDQAFSRAKNAAMRAGHVKLDAGQLRFDAAAFEDAHPDTVTEEAKAMIASVSDYGFVYPPEFQCGRYGLLAAFNSAAEWSLDCAEEDGCTPGLLRDAQADNDLRREFAAFYAENRGALSPSSLERAFRYALRVATEGPGARFELRDGRLSRKDQRHAENSDIKTAGHTPL